jgi:hypothetical protein
MLIEVNEVNSWKSIAFGMMSRYSTRWHLDGATWTERRAAEAVKERDAAAAAIDAEVFAGMVPPPMQTQIQRMGGMSSAVIGGFYEHSPVVHELVAKYADTTAQERATEHGRQLNDATAYQRHRIRQRLATGACRDFHENKIARLPYVDPAPSAHARFATCGRLTRGGEQRKTEHGRTPLGRRVCAVQQEARKRTKSNLLGLGL